VFVLFVIGLGAVGIVPPLFAYKNIKTVASRSTAS
jgi:hypothetical protein